MDIRDDVFGPAPLGAPNRISAAGKRCQGNVGTLSITPCIYGRLTALFVSAALALTIAGEARAARGARAAPPALDAQTVNEAQAPSGKKKRAGAPSAAAIIKAEVLLEEGHYGVSGRKRHQANRRARPADVGASDRHILRSGARRL